MNDLPFVSCLCVAGKDEFNLKYMLPQAVECFRRQTYPEHLRELVVVTDRDYTEPLAELRTPWLSCYRVPSPDIEPSVAKPTLGFLRNVSIDHAKGPLCLQWDSDDWHHPERIERQVRGYLANPGIPVVLKRQLCYSFSGDTAFIREYDNLPIVGTIVFPKNDFRYPEKEKSEDVDFYGLWPKIAIFDNDPALYVRLEHGHNTWDVGHILREFAGEWAKGGWHLSDRLRECLVDALRHYPKELWPDGGCHVFGWNPSRGIDRERNATKPPMLEVKDA